MSLRVRIMILLVLLCAVAYLLFPANAMTQRFFRDAYPDLTLQETRYARWIQFAVVVLCLAAGRYLRPWPSRVRRGLGAALVGMGLIPYIVFLAPSITSQVLALALANSAGLFLVPLGGLFVSIKWPSEYRAETSPYDEVFD